MSHFIKKCTCGVTLETCRCPSKDKTVIVEKKPCTHQSSQITTGEFPICVNCNKQFIAVAGTESCKKCIEKMYGRNKTMTEPKRYTAQTLPPENHDPFSGFKTHEVTGYYVKHVNATPYQIDTPEGRRKFLEEHTEHYIIKDGFSDWGLPRNAEPHRIDIKTMREVKTDGNG